MSRQRSDRTLIFSCLRSVPASIARTRSRTGSVAPMILTDVDAVYAKVSAACWFAERTGGFAAIGSINDTEALLNGEAGTRVAK